MDEELKRIIEQMQADNKASKDEGGEQVYSPTDFENVVKTHNEQTVEIGEESSPKKEAFITSLKGKGLNDLEINRQVERWDMTKHEGDLPQLTRKEDGGLVSAEEPPYAPVELDEVTITSQKKSVTELLTNPNDDGGKLYFNPEDYNSIIDGDDPKEATNSWLNSRISILGFKAQTLSTAETLQESVGTSGPHGAKLIKVVAANGGSKVFSVSREGSSFPLSPLESITTWIDSQDISNEQKNIFKLTGEVPNEGGRYGIKVLDEKEFNKYPYHKQPHSHGASASAEEADILVSLTRAAIIQAIDMPRSVGIDVTRSSIRGETLNEEDKALIRTAAFEKVNQMSWMRISKEDFNKLFKMYPTIAAEVASDNKRYKHLKVSSETLSPIIKESSLQDWKNKLDTKQLKKFELYKEIRVLEEQKEDLDGSDPAKEAALEAQIQDKTNEIKANATTTTTVGGYGGGGGVMHKTSGAQTVAHENPELSSMLFKDGLTETAILRAAEDAEAFKALTSVELGLLKSQNPALTPYETLELYHDNILKIQQQTETEFLDKKITINLGNMTRTLASKLEKIGFYKKYPQAKFKGGFYSKSEGDKLTVSVGELYKNGFTSHKLDSWTQFALDMAGDKVISDKDKELYESYEDHRIKATAEVYTAKNMLLLNTDPIAIKENISFGSSVLDALVRGGEEIFGVEEEEGDDKNKRDRLNIMSGLVTDLNDFIDENPSVETTGGESVTLQKIEWTSKQQEAFEQSFQEQLGGVVGGFMPIAMQLALVSAATGGTMTWLGATRVINGMRKSKSIWDKAKVLAIDIGVEEFKMQGLMGFNAGDGTTFHLMGKATKSLGVKSMFGQVVDQVFQKTIKVGFTGATSMELVHVVHTSVENLKGNNDFMEEFDNMFGGSGENLRRWAMNAMAFSFHGIHTVRKTDLMGEAGKYNAKRQLGEQKRRLYTFQEVDGVMHKVFGNEKLSPEKAKEQYEALNDVEINIDLMIKQHLERDLMNPKENPDFEVDIKKRFGKEGELQQQLKKYNSDYPGFEIEFSTNPADFGMNNAAEYQYATGDKGPVILINPNKYKVGKIEHEAFIHASVDAYFSKGGARRKEVFTENVADFFKGVDFGDFKIEGQEGTRTHKLAGLIENYYEGSASIKGEEFLGYVMEMLAKPEVYQQKVAQSGLHATKLHIKDILRENLGVYKDIKTVDQLMEVMSTITQGAKKGKFKSGAFDSMLKFFETSPDIASANKELTTVSSENRASKEIEIADYKKKQVDILSEREAISKIPPNKRTAEQATKLTELATEFKSIVDLLKGPEFASISGKGEVAWDFSEGRTNENISTQGIEITNKLKTTKGQELKENAGDNTGKGLRFKEIGSKLELLKNRAKELVQKHGTPLPTNAKAEFDAIQGKIGELNQVWSLKNDLKSNNIGAITKITNQLHAKSANVDVEIRIPLESIEGEMGFKEAMDIQADLMIDNYKFKIEKIKALGKGDGNVVMKNGKPVMIDNPTNFSQYLQGPQGLKIKYGNALEMANKGRLAGETMKDVSTMTETLFVEDISIGGKSTPPTAGDLITVSNELMIKGKKAVTKSMIDQANAEFNTAEFALAVESGKLDYNTFRNPNEFQFLTGNTNNKVQIIGENVSLFRNAITPKGLIGTTGKATGIPNSVLKHWYVKGADRVIGDKGNAAGNFEQIKRDLTDAEWLAEIGIKKEGKMVNGELVETYTIDKTNPEYRNIIGATFTGLNNLASRIVYNQLGREYIQANPEKFPIKSYNTTIETVLHEMSSGKAESAASMEFSNSLIKEGYVEDISKYQVAALGLGTMSYKEHGEMFGYELTNKLSDFVSVEAMKKNTAGADKTKQENQPITDVIKRETWSETMVDANGKETGGLSRLTTNEFLNNEKAQKQYMEISNEIVNELFMGKGAADGNVRLIVGLFGGHHRTTGKNNLVPGEFIQGLKKGLITPAMKSRFSPELMKRFENIDWATFKNVYAGQNKKGYEKIRNAVTLEKKLEIAAEVFSTKGHKASREVYDVWNNVLEQFVWTKKNGEAEVKGSPEWNRKMDYVALLKRNNSVVGTQGERIYAPEGYVMIQSGRYSYGKDNPDFKAFKEAHIKTLEAKTGKGKLKGDALKDKAEELALLDLRSKVEHQQSSNEKSSTSMSLIANKQFSVHGKKGNEKYVGIWGNLGNFNMVDKAGGAINSAGIYRFAANVEMSKYIYSVESVVAGKPKTLFQEMQEGIMAESILDIKTKIKQLDVQNKEVLAASGIETKGLSPVEVNNRVTELTTESREAMEFGTASARASKDILSVDANKMWEGNYDVKAEAKYSPAKARVLSQRRSWYKGLAKELFVGSGADDFKGLTNYRLVNQKGKKGELQQKFYDDALHIPYAAGVNALNIKKQQVQNDFKSLSKEFPKVKKMLSKDIPGEVFSNSNAARVYLWTKSGVDMREFGLSAKDIKKLNAAVSNNPELLAYADRLGVLSGSKGGYPKPKEHWLVEGVEADLMGITMGEGRSHYLSEFIENKNSIFSETNLNKLEAIHGLSYREALENSIYRMENGTNRVFSQKDKYVNGGMDYLNGAVGVTMFLNTRSAHLQLLSTTNYLDWGANNPINAGRAVLNQKQFYPDVAMIYNHPFSKQRRGGLGNDLNAAELAETGKGRGPKAFVATLLQKGYIMGKTADSFAISLGGSTYFRNHFNATLKLNGINPKATIYNPKTYEFEFKPGELGKYSAKQGLLKKISKETFEKTWERTQSTQQSSDPSKISQIQSSGIGRLVFAFMNTPMQYTREVKKSTLDLIAGRGDTKHNISKILYYGAAQNLLFGALQNALFTVAFDDDEKKFDTKTQRTLHGMFDTLLRGSGLPGAVIATSKNTLMKFLEEEKKGFNADHAQTLIQAMNIAPPVGIKTRKLYSSMKSYQLNKNVIPHMGYGINNPAYEIAGNLTAGMLNIPLDRIVQKSNNVREILTGDHEWWQNTSLAAGYRPWDVGIKDAEKTEVKGLVAEEKKIESKKKAKVKLEKKKVVAEKVNIEKQKEEIKEGKKEVNCAAATNDGRCGLPVEPGKTKCTVHTEVAQNKTGKKTQCTHIKKDKKRCGTMTSAKGGLCYYHD